MANDTDLDQLRKQWDERWEVWVVHRVYGGPVWCARRHDNHRKVINADTAEHLSEYLAEAEGEQGASRE